MRHIKRLVLLSVLISALLGHRRAGFRVGQAPLPKEQAITAALAAAVFVHPILPLDQIRTVKLEAQAYTETVPSPRQNSTSPKIQNTETIETVMLQPVELQFKQETKTSGKFSQQARLLPKQIPSRFPEQIELVLETGGDLHELELTLKTQRIPDRVLKIYLAPGKVRLAAEGDYASSLGMITTINVVTLPDGRLRLRIKLPASAFAYAVSTLRLDPHDIRVTASVPFHVQGIDWVVAAGAPSDRIRRVEVTERRAVVGQTFDSAQVEIPLTASLLQLTETTQADQFEVKVAGDGTKTLEFKMVKPDGREQKLEASVRRDGSLDFSAAPMPGFGPDWERNIWSQVVAIYGRLDPKSELRMLVSPQHLSPERRLSLDENASPVRLRVTGDRPVMLTVITLKITADTMEDSRTPNLPVAPAALFSAS
jgi:hypothetical protein